MLAAWLILGGGPAKQPQPRSAGCTVTLGTEAGAAAVAAALVSAADGASICLQSGDYPPVRIAGATHSAYVTVRPAPGAVVSIAGVEVADSSFLRFQGLHMSEGFNMRDVPSRAGSHDYQFVGDIFDRPLYGIVLLGGATPIKHVLIEGNRMIGVHLQRPEANGVCDAGYSQGQDVTIERAQGVKIVENVFDEADWHYIQGGSMGPEGVDVERNLFEGHVRLPCSHLNLWQIYAGGENDTFKHNLAIGEGRGERGGRSEEAATDGLIFQNGPGSTECSTKMKNTVIEDNLFVDAANSYELQIYTTNRARIKNNTVVGSKWGTAFLTEHCGAGRDYRMTSNIDVEDQGTGGDFRFGDCKGACLFDENVSQDGSAALYGASRSVTGWSPSWTSTSWDPRADPVAPAGFYRATGLPFQAGYQGAVGLGR